MSLLKTNEIQNYNGSSLTLTASTVSTSAQLNTGGNISVTGSLNVSDDSTTRTNLGLGTISTQDSDSITVTGGTATLGALTVSGSDSGDLVRITQTGTGNALVVEDSANPDSTPFVIDSGGRVLVGTTSLTVAGLASAGNGVRFSPSGIVAQFASNANAAAAFNRTSDDGSIISLRQNGTEEGTITVSGNVVLFNGFTGTHWSRLLDGSTPDIPRGTILESLDEMMDWVKEDGTLEDDIKHVKCKISDTVESKNVYGLFLAWDDEDNYNDLYVAEEGSFVIRIHSSQDVQRGDLIQSNGDGTGKIQEDDVIRSSTVAKVISTHRVETYEDGSFIVPCVIHC